MHISTEITQNDDVARAIFFFLKKIISCRQKHHVSCVARTKIFEASMKQATTSEVVANEELRLKNYLDDVATASDVDVDNRYKRVFCCNSSRSLYCPECCKVLIPRNEWPECYRENPKLALPFTMHIVLGWKERRSSSSGIHIMAIRNMMDETASATPGKDNHPPEWWQNTELYDINKGEPLPSYSSVQNSTFVLFPQKGKSVPISSVAHKIERLIIMDVKWTRVGIVQLHPQLAKLQTVHLEYPPTQSRFWRWHKKGEGMLSTMEAIYFAAIEMAAACGWSAEERERIIHVMWLFALQRRGIIRQQRSNKHGNATGPLPFSTEGKDKQRSARMKKDDCHENCGRS
jgi:hypothetical protein